MFQENVYQRFYSSSFMFQCDFEGYLLRFIYNFNVFHMFHLCFCGVLFLICEFLIPFPVGRQRRMGHFARNYTVGYL